VRLDDSIFEFALYDLLGRMAGAAGRSVTLDELRDAWRSTALRHSDLPGAIGLLVEAGSLIEIDFDHWRLTEAGRARAVEVASVNSARMEDMVARSVIKTLRDRVPAAGLAPRVAHRRRVRDTIAAGMARWA
jgi:hypothetical protein